MANTWPEKWLRGLWVLGKAGSLGAEAGPTKGSQVGWSQLEPYQSLWELP